MNMEMMKSPDRLHDMKLQGELAFRVFKMRHGVVGDDKRTHSDAIGEWAQGDDDEHVLSNYYREVLEEEKMRPQQIPLSDDGVLEALARKILERFESEATRDEDESVH